MNRNTIYWIITIALLAVIAFFGAKNYLANSDRAETEKTKALLEAARQDSINCLLQQTLIFQTQDTCDAYKRAYYDCSQGNKHCPCYVNVPRTYTHGQKLADLQKRLWDVQDEVKAYKMAYLLCMAGSCQPPVIKYRSRQCPPRKPCPTCPPTQTQAYTPPPLPYSQPTPPPAPQPAADDELRNAVFGNQGASELGHYKFRRSGQFCNDVSPDGYLEYCIRKEAIDDATRLASQISGTSYTPYYIDKNGNKTGNPYILGADGWWVYTAREEGVVTINSLNTMHIWCAYLDLHPQWGYPMFFPHELVRQPNGLAQYYEMPGTPSVHSNGIGYTDANPAGRDRKTGWSNWTKLEYSVVN